MGKRCLLIIDDNESVRKAMRCAFETSFYVYEASDEAEALQQFDSNQPDTVFLDIDFYGEPCGWDILKQIRKRNRDVPVLIITGSRVACNNPLRKLADGFLEKPTSLSNIHRFLTQAGVLNYHESERRSVA